MTTPQVQAHPASIDAYIRHGWSLVPIPPNSKGPTNVGWNLQENAVKSQAHLPPGYGIGLAHAYSGTMALDIDCWDTAVAMLGFCGVDLPTLYAAPDAVVIDSGRQGRGKLLYKMPPGLRLASKRVLANGKMIYELRCATASGLTVQDVLPPSIHPETRQPYRWAGHGHWERLPELPASILELWQNLIKVDQKRTLPAIDAITTSWAEVQSALDRISPDCSHEEWVQVGMALQYAGHVGDKSAEAFRLWDNWSKQSATKYPGDNAMIHRWNSFRSDKGQVVKLGTLFHVAKRYGWTRPPIDVSALFAGVDHQGVGKKSDVNITMSLRPPPPKCDIKLFPKVLAARAAEIAEGVGVDSLAPLWAGMAAVCGVADTRSRLTLVNGFQVPPLLWIMVIGNPAAKKSPATKPMFNVLTDIERDDLPNYGRRMLEYQLLDAQYEAALTQAEKYVTSAEGILDGINGQDVPDVPDRPVEPAPLTIVVEDITSQKLVQTAGHNQRGIICVMDEMASWAERMANPRSNSVEDKSHWTKAYEASTHKVGRMSSGLTFIENYAVAIFGNIQPQPLADAHKGMAKDGMLQRFIPIVLDDSANKVGNPVAEWMSCEPQYNQMLRAIYGLSTTNYTLSTDAYKAFREFQYWYEQVKRDETMLQASTHYLTALGKIEGLLGRLIFVFHLIEAPFETVVSVGIVNRCIELVKSYIIPSIRYVHNGDLGGASDLELWIADWLISNASDCEDGMITLADIRRSARRQIENLNPWVADRKIIDAMAALERHKWVIRIDDCSRENKGYAQWGINPSVTSLFADRADQIAAAKKRRGITD